MRMDVFNEFCKDTALPTSTNADSVLMGNVTNLGKTKTYPGNTSDLFLVIRVAADVTSNGAAKVAFELASDSTANLATSRTTHIAIPATAKATLVSGYRMVYRLPRGAYEQYLGIWATVDTAALTGVKIDAFLTDEPGNWMALPDGI